MSKKPKLERCVADAAILQDLDHTRLIPTLLDSDVNLITTPEVMGALEPRYRQELVERSETGQVVIEMATPDDMNQLINEVGPANGMSITDCLLCRIARRLNTSLLSGCELLSRNAEKRGIRARSIIWVLNRLVNKGLLKPGSAARLLADLQQRNPWMNQQRTRRQLEQWQSVNSQVGPLVGKQSLNLYST